MDRRVRLTATSAEPSPMPTSAPAGVLGWDSEDSTLLVGAMVSDEVVVADEAVAVEPSSVPSL